jgi:hypothetical protein
MIRVTRTILMLRQKVLFNCGGSAKGRAEDCGEPASAGARYPGGVSGFTAVTNATDHLLQWTWYKLAIDPRQQH